MSRWEILSSALVIALCLAGVIEVLFGDQVEGMLFIILGYLVSMDERL